MVRRRRRKKNTGLLTFFADTFFPKKKTKKEQAKIKKQWEFEISESVAREIWAVICLASGALITLSLTNQLGLPGEWLNTFLKPIFGWCLYVLPPLLFLSSVLLFLSKQIQITMAKLTGAGFFIISVASILHLSVPEDRILEFAVNGTYGGYIGFITNWFFRIILKVGNLGASMIFVPTFLISLLLTFEVSIRELILNIFYPNRKQNLKTSKAKIQTTIQDSEFDQINQNYNFGNTDDEDEINIIKPVLLKKDEPKPTAEVKPAKAEIVEQENMFADGVNQENKITSSDTENVDANEVTLENEYLNWEFPPFDLLDDQSSKVFTDDKLLKANAEKIKEKLRQFDINVGMSDVHVGPTVVQYTLKPSEGVKLSKITNLKNDLALALAAKSIRIEAPIPGKALVGIELPAEQRMTVKLREMMDNTDFQIASKDKKLTLPLGRDVSGKPVTAELSDMPHLLIAGATGAGKSVAINTFLISLLYQNSPADLKFIMVDPKQVELRDYNGIPHLLTPVITDPEKAANALKWAVAEMNRRYQTLSHSGCRNIDEYNEQDGQDKKMPKIIVLIDELADLMMNNGKEVEASICRLAQMARAVGIHLIIATQRPSVDVITGLIKANIPTRISFAVTSSIDSRTILDSMGAEELLGKGDMLYLQKDFVKPMRIQGIYLSPLEIKKVTNMLKLAHEPEYKDEITEKNMNKNATDTGSDSSDDDELYSEAYKIVIDHRKASASLLQRKLKIGYARAARLLDILEEKGIVGPVNGAKPREIYVDKS
jgi:S-DNA-T family DNA segregation ATPase FtsK/SpoIIIE